jgi:hypothetical protein
MSDDERARASFRAMFQDPICDRCGQRADARRIDVTTLGGSPEFVWGHIVCTTVGCVDEFGSASVDPPDVPGELTREDRKWLRRQQRLAEEFGRVTKLLAREVP